MKRGLFFPLLWILCSTPPLVAGDWSGYLGIEGRKFLSGTGTEGQGVETASLLFRPEFHHSWDDGYQSLHFTPFVRLDSNDDERTHFDVREFYWQKAARNWELSVGVRKVFWGVTESVHLVDILNQTDLVEDPDGESKLGQPMIQLRLIRSWGYLDFFLLPYFRERTFPGVEGRLRTIFPVDEDQTTFESVEGRSHLDWAIRWSHSIGAFDIGISHFAGTHREPDMTVGENAFGEPVLIPHYRQIDQTGLDLQATMGPWLWKLESFYRRQQGDSIFAIVGGFEYTKFDVRGSGLDLGFLLEWSDDEREGRPETVFGGTRLTFNDVQGTDILFGVLVNLEDSAYFLNLEGSRRLGSDYRLSVRARTFLEIPDTDPLASLRNDDYLQMLLSWYF